MGTKKAYQKKAERLEMLILNFTKWFDKNYETITVNEIKIYWKKLVEDYVFETIEKIIGVLSEVRKEERDGRNKG